MNKLNFVWRGSYAVGIAAAVAAVLLAFCPRADAQSWFQAEQSRVFEEYGNPGGHFYAKGNSKYLLTLHHRDDRLFLFVFYKDSCIGRVEMKQRFSSSELASQLSRYQGDSTWKLVQEDKASVEPDGWEKNSAQPDAMVETELKGCQREDRRFYALWIGMNHTGQEMHLLALGEKKAGTAIIKYMEQIGAMINQWVEQTKKRS
jgi:hypothetical protein